MYELGLGRPHLCSKKCSTIESVSCPGPPHRVFFSLDSWPSPVEPLRMIRRRNHNENQPWAPSITHLPMGHLCILCHPWNCTPRPSMATLLYGKSLLQASFPEDTDVIIIEKKAMIPLDDGVAAINDAVRQPVGTELTLHSSAEGADSACILICDITRWVSSL